MYVWISVLILGDITMHHTPHSRAGSDILEYEKCFAWRKCANEDMGLLESNSWKG